MRIQWDNESECAYVALADGDIARTLEVTDNVMLDLDANGNVLGIEVSYVHVAPEIVATRRERSKP